MRSFFVALAGLMFFAAGAAQAKVAITVDKNTQTMTVAVDGVERYQWPVSTGNPSTKRRTAAFARSGWRKIITPRVRRRADAALDLLHQGRPCHSRHRFRRPSRHSGFTWLRATVARQRLDAVCAGAAGRRSQHHRDAHRFGRGCACAQPADPARYRGRPRDPPRNTLRNITPSASRWC